MYYRPLFHLPHLLVSSSSSMNFSAFFLDKAEVVRLKVRLLTPVACCPLGGCQEGMCFP